MTGPQSDPRVSPPASTGGAGPHFEQHVFAYWLAQLLVRGRAPIIRDCSVVEVRPQTRDLGWHTDDFLVNGESADGRRRRLAGQVKRSFTVGAADKECKKTIGGFWRDFKRLDPFCPDSDRLVVVTQLGTAALLRHFKGLLVCANAASDGTEFERRLETSGLVSQTAVTYCDALRTIVGEIENASVSAAKLWPFLRTLDVLSLDLATSTGQDEAQIKTLLDHTQSGSGTHADDSWNELLALAGSAVETARCYRRDDLPDSLTERHLALGRPEEKALRALEEHTELVLQGIRSTIGDEVHLPRARLVQELAVALGSNQIVVVSGAAGMGKSAVAKDALEILAKDYFAFGFRGEEFAQAHLDSTLLNARVPVGATTLRAVLAAQDSVVLLVDSVERLLEQTTQDAFSDLLGLVASDRKLRIVLTCRSYSVDAVRDRFLANVEHTVVDVPLLDDDELEQVQSALPGLGRPLGAQPLRRLLRNPYYLDRASQLSWAPDRPLPESERELMALFWRQIVRAEDRRAGGMPQLREEAFMTIAVRRARALTAYVARGDLAAHVVESLRRDSLIASPRHREDRIAPSHDVLEDWAIARWIELQTVESGESLVALAEVVGPYPALRRAYRKWVTERVEMDPDSADRLFSEGVAGPGVPAQFRDDTLVSLLLSPSAPELLERHTSALLANDRTLLKRLIHLLRVACVTSPSWLAGLRQRALLLSEPKGPAWASVLSLVRTHVDQFISAGEETLVLGLIEDWASGVSWKTPYPKGAKDVVAIGRLLLPAFDSYRTRGALRQTLGVIAKIPLADREWFKTLLLDSNQKGRRYGATAELREIVLSGLGGTQIARDLPDVLMSVALGEFLCSEADARRSSGGNPLDSAELFGLREARRIGYSTPSAYQGPWLQLLRHHSKGGVDFLLGVLNRSADWYSKSRVRTTGIETPSAIHLTFSGGASKQQWANGRLWQWYRGFSVGPTILQSMLMALERWLLDFAEKEPEELDALLLDLLLRSNSAAVAAVVGSVATAFPSAAGETLLVLLRCRRFVELDAERLAREAEPRLRPVGSPFGVGSGSDVLFQKERDESDKLAHRLKDLSTVALELQFGPFAEQVWEILDEHRAALPPASSRRESERRWFFVVNRLDGRRVFAEDEDTGLASGGADGEPVSPTVHVRLVDGEQDVLKTVEDDRERSQALLREADLFSWGSSVFNSEREGTYDPETWREQLERAARLEKTAPDDRMLNLTKDAVGLVAAVCARDRWEEMTACERSWCVQVVLSEVTRGAKDWRWEARRARAVMAGDRACASVIPLLVQKVLTGRKARRVKRALAMVLTHPVDEMRDALAGSIAGNLSSSDPSLAKRCIDAMAAEAALVDLPRGSGAATQDGGVERIAAEAATTIRRRFWRAGGRRIAEFEWPDYETWFGVQTNVRLLTILGRTPNDPLAVTAFFRAAEMLVVWWSRDDHQGVRRSRRPSIDTRIAVTDLLVDFVLRSTEEHASEVIEPLLDAVDNHPGEVKWFVLKLSDLEGRDVAWHQFWSLWESFADRTKSATWLTRMERRSEYRELVSTLFLPDWRKESVRQRRSVEEHSQRVHSLFEELPTTPTVLGAYLGFLSRVGEPFLPRAFVRIAERLGRDGTQRALTGTGNVRLLEVLLQRYVCERPLELKRRREIRDAVLALLDELVEAGSSAAFRMRDDFVTALST